MDQNKADNRCEELQEALFSPLNPVIKWGVYITLFLSIIIILVGFNIHTTNSYNVNTSHIHNLPLDRSIIIKLAVYNTYPDINVGDDVYLIRDSNDYVHLGRVKKVNSPIEHETIVIQTDTFLNSDEHYSLRIYHSQPIGDIILSYITRQH